MAPQTPVSEKKPASGKSATTKALSGTALWVAVAAVAFWVAFSIFMVFAAGRNAIEWSRIAWVFGSIQAVAFAAAGALFGTNVQQGRAENAENRADKAETVAASQREDATKGRALATMLQDEGRSADGESLSEMGAGSQAEPVDIRQRYASLSKSLFGDLT